jgi:hypothetical protein
MNDKQSEKMRMYLSVKTVCNNFGAAWLGIPAFMRTFKEFNVTIDTINDLSKDLQVDTKGITTDKGQKQKLMAGHAEVLADAMQALADEQENFTLLAEVNFSLSDFTRAKDIDAYNLAKHIFDVASEHKAALVDYGIVEQDFTNLESAILAYSGTLSSTRSSVSETKASRSKVKELFKTSDNLLKNRLDNMMTKFHLTNPDFYSQYVNARIIIQQGSHSSTDPNDPKVTKDVA